MVLDGVIDIGNLGIMDYCDEATGCSFPSNASNRP